MYQNWFSDYFKSIVYPNYIVTKGFGFFYIKNVTNINMYIPNMISDSRVEYKMFIKFSHSI